MLKAWYKNVKISNKLFVKLNFGRETLVRTKYLIWQFVKACMDQIVQKQSKSFKVWLLFRYTTVDKSYHVPVTISGVTGFEAFKADLHPKNPEVGTKTVWRSPKVLIDGVDAETLQVGINKQFLIRPVSLLLYLFNQYSLQQIKLRGHICIEVRL